MTQEQANQEGYVELDSTLSMLMNVGRSLGKHVITFQIGDKIEWRELDLKLKNRDTKVLETHKGLYPFYKGFSVIKLISAGAPMERKDDVIEVEGKAPKKVVKYVVTETKTLTINVYQHPTKKDDNGQPLKAIEILWDDKGVQQYSFI